MQLFHFGFVVAQLRNFFLHVVRGHAWNFRFDLILLVEIVQVGCNLGVDRADELKQFLFGEGAAIMIHRAERAAVKRDQLAAKQLQLMTKQRELAANLLQRCDIVFAKIRDGFVIRMQLAQQPNHFKIARRGFFQLPASARLVEVAILSGNSNCCSRSSPCA